MNRLECSIWIASVSIWAVLSFNAINVWISLAQVLVVFRLILEIIFPPEKTNLKRTDDES